MSLVTDMLGTADHDLVVRKKSTEPELFPSGESVTCSHFEYFTERQTKAEHFSRVIEAIKKALEFDKVEAPWLNVALKKPPAADKTTTASGADCLWPEVFNQPIRQGVICSAGIRCDGVRRFWILGTS